jgi:hypothetical protein
MTGSANSKYKEDGHDRVFVTRRQEAIRKCGTDDAETIAAELGMSVRVYESLCAELV